MEKERTMGDVIADLHDECKRMITLIDEAEWDLTAWHQLIWDKGREISNLLTEIGIEHSE